MPKLKPGDQAPDLSLASQEGKEIRLSDLWGKGLTALTFYRGDFCPACNRYLHSLQERADEFREAGLQIVAVSADRPDVERQTVERHGLSFHVLSDPDHRAVHAYDVVYDAEAGHAQPAVFVISPKGVLQYEAVTSGPLGRPTPDDLLLIARGINRRRSAAA
ncbi:MAG: peroxiredoxin family protein [Chloroflexi bacterium]|nr:peroxiredoxin family protein [Chloroflexota bacterium]